jgi:multiple sugar transport system permease protein
MLAPYVVGLVGLILVPILLTTGIAFTQYDALNPPRWVGVANLRYMLIDEEFWNGLRASLLFLVLALPLRLLGALGTALLLYRSGRGVGLTRAAVYLPTIVPDIAYALLWLHIFNPLYGPFNSLMFLFEPLYGPLNGLLVIFTVEPLDVTRLRQVGANGWLLHPAAAQFATVIMLGWIIGEGLVLLMAALQDVPHELYESAAVDGADRWQQFMRITLPLLAPFLLLLVVRDTVWSFQSNFVAAVIVTRGEPFDATLYLPYWIYHNAMTYQRFGYAAAMTLVMFVITAAIILLQLSLARRWRSAYYD